MIPYRVVHGVLAKN